MTIPSGTRALIAPLKGVGRDYPLSIEKLCPVLSWYVVKDWREGCERCIQILRYGGMGHTMSIHSQNEDVILQFGLKKPAFRICVNTPTTHGSIGLTTGLDPAMTLGCGGPGGNITSDNISPRHLLNLKRLAYESGPPSPRQSRAARPRVAEARPGRRRPLPKIAGTVRAEDDFGAGPGHQNRYLPRVAWLQGPRGERPGTRSRKNRLEPISLPSSFVKTMFGRRFGRGRSFWSANGPSSRLRRETSASQRRSFSRRGGPAEQKRMLLPGTAWAFLTPGSAGC